ncbi:hypothetical protein DFR86_09575 [Acidianus sulfidivorans JP7]|uniref:Uncharacterized protein n=1 Tax=Acidianus sulfidivorans JP7 TaxID=619593 RepID=A0A2U9IP41_9CREN|nr:hypothetical protein [Acidianus sulfidivorans]AWR97771.1 hypothetical protein DFR86_09575 [Acidianus sulfidivorans JP7]
MSIFTAKLNGEKLILENKSGHPIFIREILIKYRVTFNTIEEKTGLRIITDSVPINKEINNKIEIPVKVTDISEVSVIYKKDDITLREDISV